MSIEKEIPFVIFLKSIYEVRPKKHPTANKTHHWKLRIETLKSQNDIKRVEFVLHNTFPDPIQVKKKAPFEIEEDGFGNFEMQINIKILNRKIPLPYFISLMPQKITTIQFHHSVWMVKPKELNKVLEIGGIPMDQFENEHEEMRALTKILEYVKKHSDRALDPSMFYPRTYERVVQKIKRLESSNRPSSFAYNPENDLGNSDDSSSTRLSHIKSQNPSKHNLFDSEKSRLKPPKASNEFLPSPKPPESQTHKTIDFDYKKEMKRKKTQYDSSSESDTNICTENLFASQKRPKKPDNFNKSLNKLEEPKLEKSLHNRSMIKQEQVIKVENTTKSITKPIMQSKPKYSDKSSNSGRHLKDQQKIKMKPKDNPNPDSFNKLFEPNDVLVVNRTKPNLNKNKDDQIIKRMKQESMSKSAEKKHSTPVKMCKDISSDQRKKSSELISEEMAMKKMRSIKQEEKLKLMKDNRGKDPKVNPMSMNDSNLKSTTLGGGGKIKLPEKTIPSEMQKKIREYDSGKASIPHQKQKKSHTNPNLFSRGLSRSSSSCSGGSPFSKSSSDNEIDREMFKPKKKPESNSQTLDQTKLVVRELFGDDKSDGSDEDDDDDDDQADDMGDIFSSLKSSGKKIVNNKPTQNKSQTSSRECKSEDENSSDNEPSSMGRDHNHNMSRSQSPDVKSETQHAPAHHMDLANKAVPETQHSPTLSYKDRRRLAKQLIKINDKDFFEKLQYLLLTSFRNKERSLKFDQETMKLDFHMGEISDHLAYNIKSMVDKYHHDHHAAAIDTASSHGF